MQISRVARSRGLFVLLGALALGAGCGGDSSGGVAVAGERPDGKSLTKDDRAAAEFVRAKLEEHWGRCEEGWATRIPLRNVLGGVVPDASEGHFKQYRELKLSIDPQALTEAQRLNGADYRGVVRFSASPARTYRPEASWEGPRGWSPWSDGDLSWKQLAVERRKGTWLIEDDDLFVGTPVADAELPP